MNEGCAAARDPRGEGQWLRFRVESVQKIGRHMVILVGSSGVDCVLKRMAGKDVVVNGQCSVNGHLSALLKSQWGTGTGRRAWVAVRVIEEEEERSKRGNRVVVCDAVNFESWEDVHEEQDLLDELLSPHVEGEDKSVRNEALVTWMETLLLGGAHSWKGLTVLDVGGGRGQLSDLLVEKGAHCILVDPRVAPARPERFVRLQASFDWEKGLPAHVLEAGRRVDLVLAMHADQGTEHALRFALRHSCAYAIVPCCVYPTLNPERCFKDGGVRKWSTFVKYLLSLDSEAQMVRLSFSGRSVVIYNMKPLF